MRIILCRTIMLIVLFAALTLLILHWPVETSNTTEAILSKTFVEPILTGAAPGYTADINCRTCHAELYDSYQHVGMAKSFSRPQQSFFIENFAAPPFFHESSQRYYKISQQGDQLTFKRYQLDHKNQVINIFERKIDWILGSGNKTRSYLYQTKSGEIYQLPIAWYTQNQQWGMAPGYDKKYHQGILRQVRRQCLFCHNAYPNVPEGTDEHRQAHFFPENLPQGIGCQRCHGPGAKHIQIVMAGEGDTHIIRSSIVNPARLTPDRRDEVCYQCHLLPAVALIGIRHFERTDYSFRPGERLSDYLLHVDIDDARIARADRFEINHHGYRLQQSQCFIKSAGELSCITCHNPHRKISQDQQKLHYREICQTCHQEDHHPLKTTTATASDDCISCHMPQRRTQDVVLVTMTDHNIQRQVGGPELLAPLKESEPMIDGIELLKPEPSLTKVSGEIYKVVTLLRVATTPKFVDRLEQLLAQHQGQEISPYFDLARAQIKLKRYTAAEQTLQFLFSKYPNHFRVQQWLGIVNMEQGHLQKAEYQFRQVLLSHPRLADVHFNLGLLLIKQKRYLETIESLEQAVSLRANFTIAWYYLAKVYTQLNQQDKAIEYFRRALEIDPAHTRSYLGIAQVLRQQGRSVEARRYLNHGQKMAARPKLIVDALEQWGK